MSDLPASIRQASTGDLDAIADLHARSRTAYHRGFVAEEALTDPAHTAHHRIVLGRYISSDSHTVFCASEGDRLEGFAVIGPCAIPDHDAQITTELHSLYVDPNRFRQSIGTRLHHACIQAWQAQRVTAARLWVMDYNQRARAFYTSQGWEQDGHHRPDNSALLGYRLAIPGQAR
jgi:ribosomal protein S18 acetylase RimI-like enzyme